MNSSYPTYLNLRADEKISLGAILMRKLVFYLLEMSVVNLPSRQIYLCPAMW